MKKHIWKKSFSISFVFHFIVVITIGAMVAGFHQEIQRPKEELITVNLADTPEQIAKAQEKSSFNSFSKDIENIFKHNSDNDNQNTRNENKDIKQINNVENKQIEKDEISAENGILPASNNITNTISEDDTQAISDGIGQGDGENFSGSENENSGSGSGSTIKGMAGGDNERASGRANVTEDRYSVASRFAQAVENHKSYPYAAVRLNQQGTVIINVTIDASGNLISAGVISSVNGNLDKAALNAVYNACPFSHGLGESISMNVPVNFYLN
ncbi:energy transducer TonB [Megamonas funiformis]|uniref:energy transducer TonB n=1 Tax=Megamonas funiformis TaxID=437897 RepID=UPI003F7E7F11